MKAVIFAGGVGTRLWPLSRKNAPKQFQKIIDDKSTLELAVERLFPEFEPEDIYIATGDAYIKTVQQVCPTIPKENIIGEPERKDNGTAVGLLANIFYQKSPDEPMVILWSDHLVKHEDLFKKIILDAGALLEEERDKIVFIGQKPRFASENIGWIETGHIVKLLHSSVFREFKSFKYRPTEELARSYFDKPHYAWNLGYFITTPSFLVDLYKKFQPDVFRIAQTIISSFQDGTPLQESINKHYHKMPVINLDNAILEQLNPSESYVVVEDIGWSDIGAWEALKEALSVRNTDNVIKGDVEIVDTTNSLIYNYEDTKKVVALDVEDYVVVNTKDVLLVAKKSTVSKVKKLVERYEEHGSNLT